MTVFVDNVRIPYGRMVMCHMWASKTDETGAYVEDLDGLLAMADAIGVARRWLQAPPKAQWIHFDISLGMKVKAIERGAVLTDKYGPIEHTIKLGHRSAIDLASIAGLRARFGLPADGIIRQDETA